VPLGLVTNGEQWMIVSAPRGETTGFASLLPPILWMQEPISAPRIPQPPSLAPLPRQSPNRKALFRSLRRKCQKSNRKSPNNFGYQVGAAVEMLVQAFDRIDAVESDRKR